MNFGNMPKRKRPKSTSSVSRSNGAPGSSRTRPVSTTTIAANNNNNNKIIQSGRQTTANPFEAVYSAQEPQECRDHGSNNELLEEMLRFMDLTGIRSLQSHSSRNVYGGDGGGSSNDGDVTETSSPATQEQEELAASTGRLMGRLARTLSVKKDADASGQPNSCLVTEADVVRLLIPWATKGILHHEKHSVDAKLQYLHWSSLLQCLEFMRAEDKTDEKHPSARGCQNATATTNLLSLSTMHKLVPRALQVADALEEPAKKCYCLLVDYFYQPNFDVVCDSLLPLVLANKDVADDAPTSLGIGCSTISLLRSRLEKANPKKSFQLLLRPDTFSTLARLYHVFQRSNDPNGQKEVKELIRCGLFSLEHHMDGFRSIQLYIPTSSTIEARVKRIDSLIPQQSESAVGLNSSTTSSFQCYQESLLTMLDHFLTPEGDTMYVEDKDSAQGDSNAMALTGSEVVAELVPLLLEVFLEQTSEMQNQQHSLQQWSSKKHKTLQKLADLQFRFFACLSAYLLPSALSSRIVCDKQTTHRVLASKLAALHENMELLSKFNVYQPSMNNALEKDFLDHVASLIIAFMSQSTTTGYCLSTSERNSVLGVLDIVVQINHTSVHEKLPVVMGTCLTFGSEEKTEHSQIGGECILQSVAPETSKFLATIIDICSRLRQLDFFFECMIESLFQMLKDENIAGLSKWRILVHDTDHSSHLGRTIQACPIHQLKRVIVALNQSIAEIRVGTFAKSDFNLEAASILSKALEGVLRYIPVDATISESIYGLCKEIMNDAVQSLAKSSSDTGSMKLSISLCAETLHLKNRCVFWLSNKISGKSALGEMNIPVTILEILDMVVANPTKTGIPNGTISDSFLVEVQFLCCQRIEELHTAMVDKQRILFATDAEEYALHDELAELQQLTSFLIRNAMESKECWEMAAGSIAAWAQYVVENDVDSFFEAFLLKISVANPADQNSDKEIDAQCDTFHNLLGDASFYEIPKVSCRLALAVIAFVDRCVQGALILAENGAQTRNEIDIRLEEGLRVLNCFVESDLPVWEDCAQPLEVFGSCIRLETVCLSEFESNAQNAEGLVIALRLAASRVASSTDNEKLPDTLIPEILRRSSTLLRRNINLDGRLQLLQSGTNLVSCLLARSFSTGGILQKGVDLLSTVFPSSKVTEEYNIYLVLVDYVRILFCAISTTLEKDGSPKRSNLLDQVLEFVHGHIWNLAQSACFEDCSNDVVARNRSVAMITTILRYAPRATLEERFDLESLEERVLLLAKDRLKRLSRNELDWTSDVFLITSMAAALPSNSFRVGLTETIVTSSWQRIAPFDTALCALSQEMKREEFADLMNRISTPVQNVDGTSSQLALIRTIAAVTTDPMRVDVIAKLSETILGNCIQTLSLGLRENETSVADAIVEATSLILEMASRKEVMMLRERDIALVLASITSTVRTHATSAPGTPIETRTRIFDACSGLVAFVLQRFCKQAHSCVPSMVVVLNVLLDYAIRCPADEPAILACGQKFSRLCELLIPQADVYKKHIICLIVRFVEGLRGEMEVARKNSLVPAIYCLFDMMQQHEMIQLNSMLDDVGRAHLRSVHESYKKVHVYKGQ